MPLFVAGGADASFPGTNGVIVFARSGATGTCGSFPGAELFSVHPDGSQLTQLTNQGQGAYGPAFSPSGDAVAFGQVRVNGAVGCDDSNVWRVAADGSDPELVLLGHASGSGNVGQPAWSPDGTQLAVTATVSNQSWIEIVAADGSEVVGPVRPITTSPLTASSPSWSPDGSRIAFDALDNLGPTSVWVSNADGSNQVMLFSGQSPDWSPDGTKLAYVAGDSLVVSGLDGSDATVIATGVLDAEPAWSPDGAFIAYVNRDAAIVVAAADGSGDPMAITAGGHDSNPSWQPIPVAVTPTTPSTTATTAPTGPTTTPSAVQATTPPHPESVLGEDLAQTGRSTPTEPLAVLFGVGLIGAALGRRSGRTTPPT